MKLGVMTVCLGNLSLDDTLKYLTNLGVYTVEIGCGGYPGTAHADARKLIKNPNLVNEFIATIKKYNVTVSALSVHGNAVHPQKDVADDFNEQFEAAVLLAEMVGVDTIVTFSGCPGDCDTSKNPNWVTCAWPDSYPEVLNYQWNDVLIPYWKKAAKFANEHNVTKIALEMHPGFCVYNPETVLRLREAVGDTIGTNFDPSHLFWQGIDPIMAIRALKGAIYHFHAKDTAIDAYRTATNGVLDTKNFGNITGRSWLFRTVGYGHGEEVWRGIISELRAIEYDYVMSIEHEDALMTSKEGLEKAISFLKNVIIFEQTNSNIYWA